MRTWTNRLSSGLGILAILCMALALAACSSPFGASATGKVVVNFGSGGSSKAPGVIPANVASMDISIKAPGMTPILVKLTTPSLSATIDVPAGPSRAFEILAMDSGDIPIYRGTTSMTIQAGAVHDLSVTMADAYALSYDANGADGGSVPATMYREAGAVLAVATNSGGLYKTGYVFDGWNTQANGLGTSYLSGASVTMPVNGITLFAQWSLAPSNDANLAAGGLVVSGVTLSPGFDPAIVSYTASANSSVPTVTVTPTKAEAGGSIQVRINGGGYTLTPSGSTTGTLVLNAPLGSNVIDVLVTAADTVTTKTYTVAIAKTVMVTITPGAGGNVSPGSGEFTPGGTVPLTATPNAGYRFVDWTGTATVVPVNAASANLTVSTGSTATMANFAPFNGGDGTAGTPYLITTLAQLKLMNSFRSSHFRLMANIDLASETNWLPIGDATTKFTGSFDGNGFTLDHLTINTAFDADRGLFGYVDGATITNVSLTNINFIDTFNYAGGLIGRTIGATQVSNCSVTGTMTAYQSAGGLIGMNDTGGTLVVTDCWTDVSINTDTYGSIGGLIGNSHGGSVVRSFALGNVTETSAGTVDQIGGLIGNNENTTVTDSYARGSVTGDNNIGGLIGYNSTANVTNSYSTGVVTCSGFNPGGLIGFDNASTIVSSYYDTTISGQSDSTGKGIPLSTALMKAAATHASTYVGWDFATIWNTFTDGSYPTLR